MKDIKLLIFDLDNTLINYGGLTKPSWELTCQKLVEKYDISLDYKIISNEIVRVNDELWNDEDKRPKGNFSFNEVRRNIVKEALLHLNMNDKEIIDFLVENYSYYKHKAVHVFDDTFDTLISLKERGYILALLTNGDGEFQREKIHRFHLEPFFDGIFIDGEQGVGKPEKQAYYNVLNRFLVDPNQACVIGDHYIWEVIAPIKYGLHAVFVNRDQSVHDDNKADAEIYNLKELLDIFK